MLAVNERTRLGLAVEAASPRHDAAAEAESSRPTAFAKTNSPSVLATLTRLYFDLEALVCSDDPHSTKARSEQLLTQIVIDPKHIGCPADRVLEAFGLPCKPAGFWR